MIICQNRWSTPQGSLWKLDIFGVKDMMVNPKDYKWKDLHTRKRHVKFNIRVHKNHEAVDISASCPGLAKQGKVLQTYAWASENYWLCAKGEQCLLRAKGLISVGKKKLPKPPHHEGLICWHPLPQINYSFDKEWHRWILLSFWLTISCAASKEMWPAR